MDLRNISFYILPGLRDYSRSIEKNPLALRQFCGAVFSGWEDGKPGSLFGGRWGRVGGVANSGDRLKRGGESFEAAPMGFSA